MPTPNSMQLAASNAASKLRDKGMAVIAPADETQTWLVDGKSLTFTQVLELATYGKHRLR